MDKLSAVVLCAGKGTRMLPLTETLPKPLQIVCGKTLIEWKLLALPEEVRDVILVIGHQGDQIRKYFGDAWGNKTIRYVVQEELNGTAGALLAARSLLGERFLVMMGDDLYAKEDIQKLLMLPWGVCVIEVENKEMKGEMLVDAEGNFCAINEEVHFTESALMNTGLYMLRREIFDISPVPIGGSSTELGLPHTLAVMAKLVPVQLIRTTRWMQITTPEDLCLAESFVIDKL